MQNIHQALPQNICLLLNILENSSHLNFPSVLIANGWSFPLCEVLAFKHGISSFTDVSLQCQCSQSSPRMPSQTTGHNIFHLGVTIHVTCQMKVNRQEP